MTNPVDPANIAQIGIYRLMRKETFVRYVKTWNDFRSEFKITSEKPPVEDDYLKFMQSLKDKGMYLFIESILIKSFRI